MVSLPPNYRENIMVDNDVEIVWVNQKGQVLEREKPNVNGESRKEVDDDVVVGMPLPAQTTLSPGGTRRSVSGTVCNELIGAWFTKPPEEEVPPSTSEVLTDEEDETDPDGHPCMALEPYATEYYHKERRGLLGKKRTPMETLLSWKGKQIVSPLTIACRDKKAWASEAVASFGAIMGYMGDKRTKETGMNILKSLQMRLLESGQELRDEVFCQLCKQTTSNPDAASDLRGWQLIVSILAVASPSEQLRACFWKHCELSPVGGIPKAYAACALTALGKVPTTQTRKAAPCDVEIMALVQLAAVPVLVRLLDGCAVEVAADSWTTVRELEAQVS
ncbi:unnamed protein product [Discosporangium mesarthrocarpum]